MLNNIKINIARLYEFLDTTDILSSGNNYIMFVLEWISDHNGKLLYKGTLWDFTQ